MIFLTTVGSSPMAHGEPPPCAGSVIPSSTEPADDCVGVLVRFDPGVGPVSLGTVMDTALEIKRIEVPAGLYWVKPPPGPAGADLVDALRRAHGVKYVERNLRFHAHQPTTPNDTKFGEQWALPIIDAPDAWGMLGKTRGEVVIAVLDSGVDCTHKDLAPNLWSNPKEIPGNLYDDDQNGYVDDVHGINVLDPGKPPCDESGHGTWVAGIIGAVTNNGDAGNGGNSIASVGWKPKILSCRFMQGESGCLADAAECLAYVAKLKDANVNIVATNDSWGVMDTISQTLEDAIAEQRKRGILFVTAAGNCAPGEDCTFNADHFDYPAASCQPNVVSVAATDATDALLATSMRNRWMVHVGAPGDQIVTLNLNDTTVVRSSTSMAAPHVTGAIALMAEKWPAGTWVARRNLILAGGAPRGGLSSATVSGRRLLLYGSGGTGSFTCNNQVVRSRLRPITKQGTKTIASAQNLELAAINIRCEVPLGDVVVQIEPQATPTTMGKSSLSVTLTDAGNSVLNDGIYAATWTPPGTGAYKVTFWDGAADADSFTVQVQ